MIRRGCAAAAAVAVMTVGPAGPAAGHTTFHVTERGSTLTVVVNGVPNQCDSGGCHHVYVLTAPTASWLLVTGACAAFPPRMWTCDNRRPARLEGREAPTPPPYQFNVCALRYYGTWHGHPQPGPAWACEDLRVE